MASKLRNKRGGWRYGFIPQTVYAGDLTLALLRQLREEQAGKCISAFVFTQEGSAEPMHPQSPTRYLKKLSERCGVADLHPHKLRHPNVKPKIQIF